MKIGNTSVFYQLLTRAVTEKVKIYYTHSLSKVLSKAGMSMWKKIKSYFELA